MKKVSVKSRLSLIFGVSLVSLQAGVFLVQMEPLSPLGQKGAQNVRALAGSSRLDHR